MNLPINLRRNLIVDAGYWFALFTPSDQHHNAAHARANHIDRLRVIFPWPTLYETLGTKFVKNPRGMEQIERLLGGPKAALIDDAPYRDKALDVTLREARLGKRSLSLCDVLIRLLIEDTNLQIAALLTFNVKDFHDVCLSKNVDIL
jgi:predicted nucleic acid-binding protein